MSLQQFGRDLAESTARGLRRVTTGQKWAGAGRRPFARPAACRIQTAPARYAAMPAWSFSRSSLSLPI